MRGISPSRSENARRVDSRGTDMGKRRHPDPNAKDVPPRWRDRDQRDRDEQTKKVPVNLSGPPETHGTSSRLPWRKAPNALVCHEYWRGDADITDVLDQTTALVRKTTYSLDEARACLLKLRDVGLTPDVKVYGALIAHCVDRSELREALAVLAEMRTADVAPDARIYNLLVQACNKARMYDEVRQLYAAMHQAGIARNACICSQYQNKPKQATDVQRITAACLLNPQYKASWPEALACLEEMKKVDVEADEKIFRGVVLAYPKEYLGKDVNQILDELKRAGIPVGIAVLAQLMAMCEQEGLQDKALELLEEGMRRKPPLLKSELGLSRDGTIISFYSHGVLNEVVREYETAISNLSKTLLRFHCLRKAIGPRTQFDIGIGNQRLQDIVAQCMRDLGLVPVTGVKKDGTRNRARLESGPTVLSRCLRRGDLDNALEVFREVMAQKFIPDPAECGKLISTCQENQRTNDSVETCSALIIACSKSERLDDALGYFGQMVELDAHPDVAPCSALIHACGNASRPADALAVFTKLLRFPLKSKLAMCNAMLSMCEQRGWIAETRRAFNEMLLAGVQPDAGSYFATIAAYQRGRQPKEKIEGLIFQAIHEGHFDSALGYAAGQVEELKGSILDFRPQAIATKSPTARSLSPYFAQALFRHHLGRIDESTLFFADDHDKAGIAELTGIIWSGTGNGSAYGSPGVMEPR